MAVSPQHKKHFGPVIKGMIEKWSKKEGFALAGLSMPVIALGASQYWAGEMAQSAVLALFGVRLLLMAVYAWWPESMLEAVVFARRVSGAALLGSLIWLATG